MPLVSISATPKSEFNLRIDVQSMSVTYSLLVGLFATLLVVILVKISTVIHIAKSLVMWCIKIKELRSLPSPPRRWFWGHALYVRINLFVAVSLC